MRTRSAAATLLAILGLAGCSGGSRPTGNPPPSEASAKAGAGDAGWTVVLTDLRIGPSGVGLALHPTRTPILVAADSDLPLMACPADVAGRPADPQRSSFGLHWTRCRRLGSRPVALPGTDGRSHVGIRIRADDGSTGNIRRLRVRWRCADDHFLLREPGWRRPPPTPHCGRSAHPEAAR